MNDPKKDIEKYINDYINNKFPKELQQFYGDVIGMFRAGVYLGISFAKKYYKIKDD